MFGKNEYVGLAVQDDLIRVARLRVDGSSVKVIKLDRFSLVEKIEGQSQNIKLQADSEEADAFDEEEDADSIFGLEEDEEKSKDVEEELDLSGLEEGEEEDEEMELDMVEEAEVPQSNELLIYDILSDISNEKIYLGLNIPAGHTIFQVIRDTDFSEVKQKDLIQDLEDKLASIYGTPKSSDNYSYEVREDGSLLLGSVEDESITLKAVNRARELYTGKLAIQSVIPDEIALVGLVRANYELDPDEMTGIIQFGKEKCRVVFMKGDEIWLVSPIINEGTEKKSFMNTVFSKILFQLDTGEVPSLDRILLANNTRGSDAVEFFEQNFPDIHVENLSLKDEFIDNESVDPSSIPSFTTAIGSALAASGAKDDIFPNLSFVPKYVEDRQKIFQLQWHGMLILFLIFLTPITFNYFYTQNARQIDSYESELNQMNSQLERLEPIVNEVDVLQEDLSVLKEKLTMLDTLAQGSKEWSAKFNLVNRGFQSVSNTWLTSFSQSGDGTSIQGYTLYRNRIPRIVNIFDEATLLSVNNEEIREKQVYTFSILIKSFAASDSIYSPSSPEEVKNLIGK
ncbi:PilN domain-containing protein [Fodinibius sp. AD559]|uniref:PilN domain-containing protein n=1 Tax=Fodinibius sp. AD559 TaxID=3424179 RepID=UPI004046D728